MAAMDPSSFADFDGAARGALAFLHRRLGFGLWMVTRVEGDHWVALQTENHAYDQDPVTVFRWSETFCARMVLNQGPRVAPRLSEVPAYAEALIGRQIPVGAYIGVPLRHADGRLFGTLCGIDPEPQPEAVAAELPLVELIAALLSTVLQGELAASAAQRRAEQAQAEALTDSVTGLYNRRGWDTLLTGEDARCRRYGHPACVVSLGLGPRTSLDAFAGDAAGDAILAHIGQLLRHNARAHDIVARVGEGAFAILGVECERGAAEAFEERLRAALGRAGVDAAIGLGIRDPAADLYHAWERADQAMLAEQGRSGG
jgi:diguanylate cyclase